MSEELNLQDNSEIDAALKEFEAKSNKISSGIPNTSSIPKVGNSGIVFDTDSYRALNKNAEVPLPKMVKIVMKLSGGAIKDQKQAEYVLLGVALIAFLISLFLFLKPSLSKQENRTTPSLEELINLKSIPTR